MGLGVLAAACGSGSGGAFSIPEQLENDVYLTGVGIAGREDLPRSVYLEAAERGCTEGG